MADRKISDLTALTAPASGDFLPIVDISEAAAASKNKRIDVNTLLGAIPAGTVTSAMIADGAIFNADVNASAAIAGTKISPNFGSQNVTTTGRVGIGTSAPSELLDIDGDGDSYLKWEQDGAAGAYSALTSGGVLRIGPYFSATDRELVLFTDNNNNSKILTGSNTYLFLGTNKQTRMTIDNTGLVGIGENGPDSTLTIKAAASVTPLRVSGPSSEFCRVDTSGRLLVGTSSIDYDEKFKIATGSNTQVIMNLVATGTSSFGAIKFRNGSGEIGSISFLSAGVAYNTSSDYRLKENVVPLTGAADRLQQIPVHRFNFISDPDTTVDGFLAHEAQAVVPECATGTRDEMDADGNPVYQGIDQSKLVPLLTAALQEALAKIATLEQRLTDAGIA